MKTILLCGYRQTEANEEILGRTQDSNGVSLLDRKIARLKELGHEVVCVLAGNSADELLRTSQSLEDCELIFDTNDAAATLASNARAATFALENEACFLHPLEIPLPPPAVWHFLMHELAKVGYATSHAVLQAIGTPCQFGFPLLLTRNGAKLLRNTPAITRLVHPQLKYLHLYYSIDGELEQVAKPL
jgi:hypothetical protein